MFFSRIDSSSSDTSNKKWLSTKNRSPRRSTPRHAIAMASTAKPPDPMPQSYCQSRARTAAIYRKPCFRGPTGCMRGRVCSGRSCMRGAQVRRVCTAGVWATTWVRGGGTWSRGWAAYVGRVPLASARTREDCVRPGAWGVGRRCVFPQCGVGHAWTLGLVRRPVALSGLLRRSPSEAWHGCCVESWYSTERFLTMRTLRVARS
jgi:hypothetical protein